MSVMAGFDFVLEISKAAVEWMIKSNLTLPANTTINGQRLEPAFEWLINASVQNQAGYFYLIVTDPNAVQLTDLTPDEKVIFNIAFTSSSIVSGNFIATSLSGNVNVTVPLGIVARAVESF